MLFGKKQIEQLSSFTGTAVAFGLAGFIAMVYITDWRVVAGYLPYYNGKFKNEKKEKSGCE
jgi:ubiquinol-cytochrome c reductase subunit 10